MTTADSAPLLLMILSRQFADTLNKCSGVCRINFWCNAVSQVEYMTCAVTKAFQNGSHFLTYTLR